MFFDAPPPAYPFHLHDFKERPPKKTPVPFGRRGQRRRALYARVVPLSNPFFGPLLNFFRCGPDTHFPDDESAAAADGMR